MSSIRFPGPMSEIEFHPFAGMSYEEKRSEILAVV